MVASSKTPSNDAAPLDAFEAAFDAIHGPGLVRRLVGTAGARRVACNSHPNHPKSTLLGFRVLQTRGKHSHPCYNTFVSVSFTISFVIAVLPGGRLAVAICV